MRKALLIFSAFALLSIFSAARPTIAEQPPVVCIDPGHPSETSALLEAKGMRTVMTKSAEAQLVRNRDRAMIANRARARLMVRLHCDASNDSGFALYAPDRQGSVEGVTGPSPQVIERSQQAARAIHQGMAERLAGLLRR